jgi:outer membrane protein OmpA-like peptidoglycan-associated protein
MTENVTNQSISLKRFAPEGLLMTLYFDFDSSDLTNESARRLEEFVNDMGEFSFDKLSFEGFADEIGSDNYNLKLSERRAETVVRFLQSHFITTTFQSVGHGRTILTPEEVKEEIGTSSWKESGIDWIQINRRARRVEIYNKR